MHMGTSEDFNVHPYPRTGNLKDAKTGFTYKGSAKEIKNVLTAFANALQDDAAADQKSAFSFDDFSFDEATSEEVSSQSPVFLTSKDFAAWPIFD